VANLARADQFAHGAGGVLDRDVGVTERSCAHF
jgi:hypothetical protein